MRAFLFPTKICHFSNKKMGIFSRVKLTNFADVLRKKKKFLISKLKKRKKKKNSPQWDCTSLSF
jgi:hypothetical protein